MARGGEHLAQRVVVKMDFTVVLSFYQQCGHGWVPATLPGRKTVCLERSTVMWDVAGGEVYGCGGKGHTGTLAAGFCCERRTTLKSLLRNSDNADGAKMASPEPYLL